MNSLNRCKPLLGTYVETHLSGTCSDIELIQYSAMIFTKIAEIEQLMSFHNDDSELSYINNNAHKQTCTISNEMKEVLEQALKISNLTNGLYDITIGGELVRQGFLPHKSFIADDKACFKDILLEGNQVKFTRKMQLDLGGIAKGYAVDQAFLTVKDKDIRVVINAGGDLIANDWENELVNIKIPSSKAKSTIAINMQNKAIATSASYYFSGDKNPIIIPSSKQMLNDNRSVSVFAENCMLADALTKVAFLDDNHPTIMKYLGAKAIFINEEGEMI